MEVDDRFIMAMELILMGGKPILGVPAGSLNVMARRSTRLQIQP